MMKGNRNIWRATVAFAIIGIVSLAFAGCPTKVESVDGGKETSYVIKVNDGGNGSSASPNLATVG